MADGFYKLEEKTKAKRVPFRWTMSDFNGEIMISGTEKILKYNVDNQEYWIENRQEYFKKLFQSDITILVSSLMVAILVLLSGIIIFLDFIWILLSGIYAPSQYLSSLENYYFLLKKKCKKKSPKC